LRSEIEPVGLKKIQRHRYVENRRPPEHVFTDVFVDLLSIADEYTAKINGIGPILLVVSASPTNAVTPGADRCGRAIDAVYQVRLAELSNHRRPPM
jgi:hypothetical protein